MDRLLAAATILAGYLVGAIPFGYLVARGRGVDIFRHGSGNIGATNVGRVLGRKYGALVFALDFAKGALPVGAALALRPLLDEASAWRDGWLEVLTGLAAFLGHLFPVYLGFRGGKGVATGTGVVAVLFPGPTAVALGVWLVTAVATRYVSLASVLACLALVGAYFALAPGRGWSDPRTLFCVLSVGLVILKHRANLARLARGTENQLRESVLMDRVGRSLHVLALGLWFGSAVFFSFVVGLSLFGHFEALGESADRPAWFPLTPAFAKADDAINGPKEQGTRAAGFAVGPMFPWYFLIQGVCGFVALLTAVPWVRREPTRRVHRWRVGLLVVALAIVVAGWPIEEYVSALRVPRNETTEAYLRAGPDDASARLAAMRDARSAFARWHVVSLLLNLAAIGVVGLATALAAHLPERPPTPMPPKDASQ
jgi:acyl-phosphate glycerol 3-phosphate acyltransferase